MFYTKNKASIIYEMMGEYIREKLFTLAKTSSSMSGDENCCSTSIDIYNKKYVLRSNDSMILYTLELTYFTEKVKANKEIVELQYYDNYVHYRCMAVLFCLWRTIYRRNYRQTKITIVFVATSVQHKRVFSTIRSSLSIK